MNNNAAAKTLLVRLPEDVKLWLMREAERNMSSQNSELVRAAREKMEAQRHMAA
jgi:hypothetical protein